MPKVRQLKTGKFRVIPIRVCRDLVLSHHYSKRMPASVQLCYGDVDYGPPTKIITACCIFSNATGRWEDKLWELTRLVKLSRYDIPLTKLISKAVGAIRKERMTDLIVSFADIEEDHHGGIYQACSWVYAGVRGKRLDGFNIDGNFVPARTCNAIYGTSSEKQLPNLLSRREVVPHYDIGKHCYWKSLTKDGMKKAIGLGLTSKRYPKPMLILNTDTNATGKSLDHLSKGVIDLKRNKKYHRPNKFSGGDDITEAE